MRCSEAHVPAACARSARSTWPCGISPARRPGCRSTGCSAPTRTASRPMPAPRCSTSPRPMRRRPSSSRTPAGPPTRSIRRTPGHDIEVCEAVRRAVGDDYTLMLDQHLVLRLPGGGAGRPRHRGARLPLVRGPAARPGHLQLRQAAAEARIPILATEYPAPGSNPTRPGSCCRPPTTCAATSR